MNIYKPLFIILLFIIGFLLLLVIQFKMRIQTLNTQLIAKVDTVCVEKQVKVIPDSILQIIKDKNNEIKRIKKTYSNIKFDYEEQKNKLDSLKNEYHEFDIEYIKNLSKNELLSLLINLEEILKNQNNNYYETEFNLKLKEFVADITTYSPMYVDSLNMNYTLNRKFIDSIFIAGKQSVIPQEYPTWKKMGYIISGSLFTGFIFYLVK